MVKPTAPYPSLKERLILLVVYSVALWVAGGAVTGLWLPTGGGEWLWWLCAVALYVFNSLEAPFFVRPRDSLANAISSALMLFTVDLASVAQGRSSLEVFRWLLFAISVATAIVSTLAVASHSRESLQPPPRRVITKLSYQLAVALGNGPAMFTAPALISIVGFHQQQPIAMLWLVILWVFIIAAKPAEVFLSIRRVLREAKTATTASTIVGHVSRIDDPNLLRVSLNTSMTWRADRLHLAFLPGNRHVQVIPLFLQTLDDQLVGTGLCIDAEPSPSIALGEVWTAPNDAPPEDLIRRLAGNGAPADLVGFVVEDSNLPAIRFEVAGTRALPEGTVVFARDDDQTVYYQVLDVSTKEEVFTHNPRGTHVVLAGQLGTIDPKSGFRKYGWVPCMNSPVFLPRATPDVRGSAPEQDEFVLGQVAQTNMPVRASLSEMLAFHTAILGVTGSGKTELVLDIVRAHLSAGRKVVCVDFTGEYKPRLDDQKPQTLGFDHDRAQKLEDLVNAIEYGQYKSEAEKKALDNWMAEALPDVEKRVATFIESDGPAVGIFELEDIANTRATLRATELYLSAIFSWARAHRRAREIVIVLEEAHTVIPETVMFGFDKGETQAVVGRMAQIALQGRKYGVGLLLVSQRTALVSKTLLSQCNTTICFAMYDKTGLDYLASVFASEHVRAIPNLRFLQAIAFGKAIKSERPIIFEIPINLEKQRASEALDKKLKSDGAINHDAVGNPNAELSATATASIDSAEPLSGHEERE